MKYVLYVPGLKQNLLSIFSLDAKGIRVAFVDGQVLVRTKGKTINDAIVIEVQEGGLYKLKGQIEQALVHESIVKKFEEMFYGFILTFQQTLVS